MMWRRVQAWFASAFSRAGTGPAPGVPRGRRALPSYVLAYFDNLVSEYDTICCYEAMTPEQHALINKKSCEIKDYIDKREKKELTWRELFIFEKLILHLQPLDRLRRRAWHLRAQFAAVFGRDELDAYLGSNPLDPLTAEEQVLRADLEQILSRFHWLYTVIPHRERIRDQLSKRIIKGTIIGVFGALLILFLEYIWPKYQLGPLVMALIMGVIGSCVSMQRRLQTISNTGDPIVNMETLKSALSSVMWTPLTGAIFAALIYLMFLGGLLEGALFPKFTPLTSAPPTPFTTSPLTSKDLGLLLVWAFVAGFAERLVPDALDRMMGQYQGEATGRVAAAPASLAGRYPVDIRLGQRIEREGKSKAGASDQNKEGGGSGRKSTGGGDAQGSEP